MPRRKFCCLTNCFWFCSTISFNLSSYVFSFNKKTVDNIFFFLKVVCTYSDADRHTCWFDSSTWYFFFHGFKCTVLELLKYIKMIELLWLTGLAFDRTGRRLGRGGGYGSLPFSPFYIIFGPLLLFILHIFVYWWCVSKGTMIYF